MRERPPSPPTALFFLPTLYAISSNMALIL